MTAIRVPKGRLDEYMRTGGFLLALCAAIYAYVVQGSQVAEGAVLALLGLAGSYLFRGRVEQSQPND